MHTIGVKVDLIIPVDMTPEQAIAELKTSIGFGRAVVQLLYVIPDPTDE